MDSFYSTLILVAIIVVVGLVIYGLARSETNGKYILYIAGFCLICAGAYSTFTAIDYYSKQSTVYGTLEEHDPYEDFNFFEYEIEGVAWYYDTDTETYYYSVDYATTAEFEGKTGYTLLLNNSPCDTQSANGKLQGVLQLNFYDVDGTYITDITITTTMTFYSSSLKIKVDTTATNENISYLEEYIAVNGLSLRIIDKSYSQIQILKGESA